MSSSTIDSRPSFADGQPEPSISRSNVRVVSFLVGLAVALSGLTIFRLNVGPLSGHPHFLLLPFVGVLGHYTIARTPAWVRWFAALTVIMSALAIVQENNVSFAAKTLLTGISLVLWSGFFRKVDQAVLGAAGYLAGASAIVLYALAKNERGFFHGELIIFDVGNKNSTALYVLPALISCVLLLRQPNLSRVHQLAISGGGMIVLAGALQSENRAALGGIAITALFVVFLGRSKLSGGRRLHPLRRIAGLGFITVATAGLFAFGPSSFRDAATGSGQKNSAGTRGELITAGWETFIDNPIAGAGPDTLQKLLASSASVTRSDRDAFATHNVYILILGAFGIVGAIVACFVVHRYWRSTVTAFDPALARLALLLFLYEGIFSAEIIFAPPLLFALCVATVASPNQAALKKPAPQPMFQYPQPTNSPLTRLAPDD